MSVREEFPVADFLRWDNLNLYDDENSILEGKIS